MPGEPPTKLLARQLRELFGSGLVFGFVGTSENPKAFGVTGHGAASPSGPMGQIRRFGCLPGARQGRFFMKFRAPQALNNRRQKPIVCSTLAKTSRAYEDFGI